MQQIINSKVCTKCKKEKSFSEFCKKKGGKFGLRSECKECGKQYRQANKEKISEQRKQYLQSNKEKISEQKKQYRQSNKEKIAEQNRKYRQFNKEKIKVWYYSNREKLIEISKKYYHLNKENIKQQRHKYSLTNKEKKKKYATNYRKINRDKLLITKKEYYQKSKEKNKEKNKEYYQKNKEKKKEYAINYRKDNKKQILEYSKKKYKECPMHRLRVIMSTSMRCSLKKRNSSKRGASWLKYVDYTLDQLKEHLEKQFDDNMTWENQGSYWHIDHIIPVSRFNYSSPHDEEFKKCWALSNLQPLEKLDNISKGAKTMEEWLDYKYKSSRLTPATI